MIVPPAIVANHLGDILSEGDYQPTGEFICSHMHKGNMYECASTSLKTNEHNRVKSFYKVYVKNGRIVRTVLVGRIA